MTLAAPPAQDDRLRAARPLLPRPPRRALAVSVVIPARNEESAIAATLQRLLCQRDATGEPLDPRTYEVIVLCNNCSDRTAEVARCFAAAHPEHALHVVALDLPPAYAHVGGARRLLMDEASERLAQTSGAPGLIATTDADTIVAPTWIAAMRAAISAGADAVGGRALLHPCERAALPPAVYQHYLRDLGYRRLVMEYADRVDPLPWDPWPRHHQHFGASFAVTVAAYERAGRLPVLPAREDEALYQALLRTDARVRHSPAVRVTTSARRSGRTPIGLAAQLRDWDRLASSEQPFLVPSADAVAEETQARAALRRLWRQARAQRCCSAPDIAGAAITAGVDRGWLQAALLPAAPFGALWSAAEQRRADSACPRPWVDVRMASAGLRRLLGRPH